MIVKLEEGDMLKIKFKGADGEFEVHFDSSQHPDSLVVKETAGLDGNVCGGKWRTLYVEQFDDCNP